MAIYLLKINVCLIILYGFYRAMFGQDTFFGWRRAMLIGIYAVALCIPLLNIEALIRSNESAVSIVLCLCRSSSAYGNGTGRGSCILMDGACAGHLSLDNDASCRPVYMADCEYLHAGAPLQGADDRRGARACDRWKGQSVLVFRLDIPQSRCTERCSTARNHCS